jgi:hypothetical protein
LTLIDGRIGEFEALKVRIFELELEDVRSRLDT